MTKKTMRNYLSHWVTSALVLCLCGPLWAAFGSYQEAMQAGREKDKANQSAEARAAYTEAVGLAATDIEKTVALRASAETLVVEKNFSTARDELQKILALENTTSGAKAQVWRRSGDIYGMEQKWAEAREAYGKVASVKDAPNEHLWGAQMSLAGTFDKEQKHPEARAEYSKLLSMTPVTPAGKPLAQIAIGDSYLSEKNYPEARKAYQAALDMPDIPDVQKRIAQRRLDAVPAAEAPK